MLESIDLSVSFPKKDFKAKSDELLIHLGTLQRQARDLGIPVAVVFEGWDAAGKGSSINFIIQAFDPRGFQVHPIFAPTEEEFYRPFLWRFWNKIPKKGQIVIFDRSWYGRVLIDKVNKFIGKKTVEQSYKEINNFEKTLIDDGYAVIKFWLHIDKKEQKKRFKKIKMNPATRWKVTKEDQLRHKQYDKYYKAVEQMLQKTSPEYAPWNIVASHDKKHAQIKILEIITKALETAIEKAGKKHRKKLVVPDTDRSILRNVDMSLSVEKEEYKKRLKKAQLYMRDLEHIIYTYRIPVVMAFEGSDAGGKGGAIKRLVRELDPRGYEVIPVAAPNDSEKARHYLWRFWRDIPKAGHITIFDRTWYGRVLVERVEGFCSKEEWLRAYREINDFEEQLVSFGTVVIKFWMQIDKDEQLRRFEARKATPYKAWKITDEDWRNREKWDEYEQAVCDMVAKTSTIQAPWTVVEANDKLYARLKVIETAIAAIEEKL